MILDDLRLLARGYIPGAKASVITDVVLNLILNNGVKDIAAYTACLKKNISFDVISGQSEYIISTLIIDYLTPDKPGLWWNNGTRWEKLNPRTLKWLDDNRPNWRNLASGNPQDYSIDGNVITIVPNPITTLASGFKFYYGAKPVTMSSGDHYPFSGSTTEYPHLSIFDEAIINYAEWKINPILNKDQNFEIKRQAYLSEREEKFLLFKRRKDIASNDEAKLQGKKIC